MNQFVSKQEMNRRVRKTALENEIYKCTEGIEALKMYRAKLRQQLEKVRVGCKK